MTFYQHTNDVKPLFFVRRKIIFRAEVGKKNMNNKKG